jgi:hypothetical protein
MNVKSLIQRDSRSLQEKTFSPAIRLSALLVSGYAVFAASMQNGSPLETTLLRILAASAVLTTMLLLVRNRFALHAASALVAVFGLMDLLTLDFHNHDLIFWIGKVCVISVFFWESVLLFRLGGQLASSSR